MELSDNEKETIESIFKSKYYEVFYIEDRKNYRNGLIRVNIMHESQTLPNEWIGEMLNNGFVISCVCGNVSENITTDVYFERIKGASF